MRGSFISLAGATILLAALASAPAKAQCADCGIDANLLIEIAPAAAPSADQSQATAKPR